MSSESRTDSGNGACEVLYIDGFDNVTSPNRGWRATMWAGLIAVLLGLVLWFFLPVRADD